MTAHDAGVPIEDLLQRGDWVRRVAAAVVHRPEDVDDATQHVWLAALRAPPMRAAAVKRWVRTVLVNFTKERYRSDRRRDQRETVVAKSRDLVDASSSELTARVELQREVAAAVLRLDEPYQTVILLRYYENLPRQRVAERCGVGLETVKTRQKRAMQLLRVDLKQRLGVDDDELPFVLLPLLRWPSAAPDPGSGSGAAPAGKSLGWIASAAAIALLVTGGAIAIDRLGGDDAEDVVIAAPPAERAGLEQSGTVGQIRSHVAVEPEAGSRESSPALSGEDTLDATEAPKRLRMRLADYRAELGSVRLSILPHAVLRSQRQDPFDIDVAEAEFGLDPAKLPPADVRLADLQVTVQHPDLVPVVVTFPLTADREFASVPSIPLIDAVVLTGHVSADDGAELHDVHVGLLYPHPGRPSSLRVLDSQAPAADGAFRLRAAPGDKGIVVAFVNDRVPDSISFSRPEDLAGGDLALNLERGEVIAGTVSALDRGPAPRSAALRPFASTKAGFRLADHALSITEDDVVIHGLQVVNLAPFQEFRFEYRFAGLTRSSHHLTLVVGNTTRDASARLEFDVEAPSPNRDIVLDGGLVDLTVTRGGEPLAGARVTLRPISEPKLTSSFTTDSSGHVLIRVVAGREYELDVQAAHCRANPDTIILTSGKGAPVREIVDLVPLDYASWRVKLLSPGGSAFPQISVGFLRSDVTKPGAIRWREASEVSSDGTHTFDRLVPGRYEVWLRVGASHHDPQVEWTQAVGEIALPADSERIAEFSVRPAGRVRLEVRDADGGLIAAECSIFDAMGQPVTREFVQRGGPTAQQTAGMSDARAPVEVYPALPLGDYTVETRPRRGKIQTTKFTVVAGEPILVTVKLEE